MDDCPVFLDVRRKNALCKNTEKHPFMTNKVVKIYENRI